MAKTILWIITIALLYTVLFGDNHTDNQQLALLISLCILTISEAIEKIGSK